MDLEVPSVETTVMLGELRARGKAGELLGGTLAQSQ